MMNILSLKLIEIEQAVFDARAGAEMEGEEGGEDQDQRVDLVEGNHIVVLNLITN